MPTHVPASAPRNAASPRWRAREIVIALEPDGAGDHGIALALTLARHFAADLVGLLVESDALLRAAALPFAFEVCRHGGDDRRLDPALLERRFRQSLQRLNEVLLAQAGASGLTAQVHSLRGHRLAALTARDAADIIVFPHEPRSRWTSDELLVVLESPATDRGRLDDAAAALQGWSPTAPWERMPWTDAAETLRRLQRRRPRLVLTSLGTTDIETLRRLIDALDCPVVVLR